MHGAPPLRSNGQASGIRRVSFPQGCRLGRFVQTPDRLTMSYSTVPGP